MKKEEQGVDIYSETSSDNWMPLHWNGHIKYLLHYLGILDKINH